MKNPESVFSDLKVVDFASYIAGPAAATILSDFGATVIKVEPPGSGDAYRQLYTLPPNPISEHNYAWQLTNRNKRSIALNLKDPSAKDVVARLIKWADVVVSNFPPQVGERLGLTYEKVATLNSRVVYAEITGYGTNGPEANKPGFDITAYWARTGLMQMMRDGDSPPALPLPGSGDHSVATTLYSAIVTGLYRREKTGKGSHVSTSLIAGGAWAAAAWIEGGLNGAKFYGRSSRKTPPNALLNTYRTADDRWLVLVAAQGKDWQILANAMQLQTLIDDPRFASSRARATNAGALVEILDAHFAKQPLSYWKRTFDEARVIYGVVQIADEIVNDRQMYENDVFVPLAEPNDGVTHTVSSPVQIAGVSKVAPGRAPHLGEHSHDVLHELGFAPEEITSLFSNGVVAKHNNEA
ncbi:CaiB/BaiF CoA transferase family protein [Paraburkholderia fungorum]|uniref:CaiB/BaiF CoA transferase family protein n=1 Tax=Paraburkholderia fungorum TaxID=134537 RepID=UPI00402B1A07